MSPIKRIKGRKAGSANNINQKVYEKLGRKVPVEDIELIVKRFWGMNGFTKLLHGTKSFSIKRLFFFAVNPRKEIVLINNRKKSHKEWRQRKKKQKKLERL